MEKFITKKFYPTTCFNCEQCKKKISVIIENKKYYCGECYCLMKGIRPYDQINDFKKKNKN